MTHDGRDNIMVILSSPSGVGKTTLQKKFNKNINLLKFQFHMTTRAPRSNEGDGVDYQFTSKKEFENLINQKSFMNMQKFLKIIMVH